MRKIYFIVVFFCTAIFLYAPVATSFKPSTSFKESQKKFSRVRDAYVEKEAGIKKLLREKSIDINTMHIFIRVFKKEALLEAWATSNEKNPFILLNTYDICSSSGDPGPKRKGRDGQVPEGFYNISDFNPFSNFYLSLKVNYPNQSDKILSDKKNPGGDIFIHGNCVTIGCMPITDDKIKELYVLVVEAKNNGQEKIPVHIFPCKMDEKEMSSLEKNFSPKLFAFWKNLKPGYDFFEKEKRIPVVTVKGSGEYLISGR